MVTCRKLKQVDHHLQWVVDALVHRPGELVVRIVNGAGGTSVAVSGGFGLVGLGERVRTLGGRLTAEPRLDGGFVVEAVLPA